MSMDFLFENLGEQDYLTVGIGEELVYFITGKDVQNGVLANTGFLDVSILRGQDVELFIGLNSDGTAGGTIAIENVDVSHYCCRAL